MLKMLARAMTPRQRPGENATMASPWLAARGLQDAAYPRTQAEQPLYQDELYQENPSRLLALRFLLDAGVGNLITLQMVPPMLLQFLISFLLCTPKGALGTRFLV